MHPEYEDYGPYQRLQAGITESARPAGRRFFVEMNTPEETVRKQKKGQNTYRLYNERHELIAEGVPNHLLGFVDGLLWRLYNKTSRLASRGKFKEVVIDTSKAVLAFKGSGVRARAFIQGAAHWNK